MDEALLVLGMFAATFSTRYLLLAMAGRVHFAPWLGKALGFVPPTVLTAIVVPAVLLPKGEVWLSPANPWLIAGLIAAVVAFIRKDLLTTIVVGMLVFALLRFGLGL